MITLTPQHRITNNYKQEHLPLNPKTANFNVHFGNNVHQFCRLNTCKEVTNLANIFLKSLTESIDGKKANKTPSFLDKIMNWSFVLPYKIMSYADNSITEVVKSNNKTLGGYMLAIEPNTDTAHIGFLTLAPDNKGKRESLKTLLELGKRIHETAKINKMEYIEWTASKTNKGAMKLFKRCEPTLIKSHMNTEFEYGIHIDKFKKFLDEYEKKISQI